MILNLIRNLLLDQPSYYTYTYYLDIQSDGRNDLRFHIEHDSYMYRDDPNVYESILTTVYSTNPDELLISGPFHMGDIIDETSDWTVTKVLLDYYGINNRFSGYYLGSNPDSNTYLGLKFISETDTYYGWLRYDPSITVYDAAINNN